MNLKLLLRVFVVPVAMLWCFAALAQETVLVSGRVSDSKDGSSLIGVSIVAKGTALGTSTDGNGNFTLRVPKGATLVFSYVGFQALEQLVTGGSLSILMTGEKSNLNEVVVIGYGTQRKKDLTGAVSQISTKDFVKGPITSPENLISGKVAGVQITQGGGQPGEGATVRIRGGASLNASNDPLWVVDGVPLEGSAVGLINPNDIESFSILKDASSAAIYGSRAANGVIIVTTKKGVKGSKLRLNFSTNNTISTNRGGVDVLSGDELRSLIGTYGNAADKGRLGSASTVWTDQIFQSAFMSDNNLNLSGGLGIPYRLSLGFLSQDGTLKGGNLQRSTVGFNLAPKLLDNHLSINLNVKYGYSKNIYANQGAIGSALLFDPTAPLSTGKSEYLGYYEFLQPNGSPVTLAPKNPLGILDNFDARNNVNRLIGNVVFDYKFHFLPALRWNVNLGGEYNYNKGYEATGVAGATGYVEGKQQGRYRDYNGKQHSRLFETYLNYTSDLKALKSRIDFTAGHSYQYWLRESDAFATLAFNRTDTLAKAGLPGYSANALLSFYGRLIYTLNDKYILTGSLRRDGSSRFAKDRRWGNFPALNFAWKLGEEKFMKNSKIFSDFKIRGGWGITGQQNGIGDYGYNYFLFKSNPAAQYQFGSDYIGLVRPSAFDANLKWEETESRNVGVDLGLFDNRITFNGDYFEKTSRDLLAEVDAVAGTNFSNKVTTNIGVFKVRGYELTLNTQVIKSKKATLDVALNMTGIVERKIKQLQPVFDPSYVGFEVGSTGFNNVQVHSVGYRPFTYYLYQQVYDSKTGKPIEGVYEDRNRDGIISAADKVRMKSPEAIYYLGMSVNGTYGKFGYGMTMRSNLQNYMYNAVKANNGIRNTAMPGTEWISNAHADVLNTNFKAIQTWSDYYLENASFLRMDNLYVNYALGSFKYLKDVRISAAVQNVFVITKYTGLDPEIGGGIDNTIYPRPTQFSFGLSTNF